MKLNIQLVTCKIHVDEKEYKYGETVGTLSDPCFTPLIYLFRCFEAGRSSSLGPAFLPCVMGMLISTFSKRAEQADGGTPGHGK